MRRRDANTTTTEHSSCAQLQEQYKWKNTKTHLQRLHYILILSNGWIFEYSNEAILLCRNTGTKRTIPEKAVTLQWPHSIVLNHGFERVLFLLLCEIFSCLLALRSDFLPHPFSPTARFHIQACTRRSAGRHALCNLMVDWLVGIQWCIIYLLPGMLPFDFVPSRFIQTQLPPIPFRRNMTRDINSKLDLWLWFENLCFSVGFFPDDRAFFPTYWVNVSKCILLEKHSGQSLCRPVVWF